MDDSIHYEGFPTAITETSEGDIENGVYDEYDVIYSPDGTRLLKLENKEMVHYEVKTGCKVICDRAFYECSKLESVMLPAGLKHLSDYAFEECENLQAIYVPASEVERYKRRLPEESDIIEPITDQQK